MPANTLGDAVVEVAFPAAALVPKAETGVLNFLQKYPDFNGRDVTIAIFDSGVDPRATGLETLCDGTTVKVIERFDCSGCGDVDTTKVVKADGKSYIEGLSGRQLKLTPNMIAENTANGEFRLGLKNFNDLVPAKVRDNIKRELKRTQWSEPHRLALADVSRKITEFEAQNPGETSKLPWDKKLIKENLDNTLELLNNQEKSYFDIKSSYDCILYQTAKGWQVVIDNTEKGDLENALHIGEYTKTHEVKNVDKYMSVSVNVHDEGKVLEVVGMCSSHGTHVASIASGNHGQRDVDGVAPNAKIVSITIGDGRLGSMETGTALVRGMIRVMEMCREGRRVDVINMSYGEHAHWANAGRIGELMSEVVNKYGVVWVASAGNHGPALCTVGTPPDIQQPSCIAVGAYVSPQMMEAEYTMREKLPANLYTWTSRDPCIDGGQGVTVCAPGGAITSVPQFTMSKSQMMNGTSMAAPHVAGAIALLISGLKQSGIQYSPFSIKRAVSATATKLSYADPFAQGHGLLNVEKAFEHLVEHQNAPENMLRFQVRVGQYCAKGIHIREAVLKKLYEFNVNIDPIFFNDTEIDPKEKFNFNVRLNLVCSHPFVSCGQFLDLCYGNRSITVKVDPTGLPVGVHTAVIRAYDTKCIAKGSLFEIPVTVVQPHEINCTESHIFTPPSAKIDGSIEFEANTIIRDFVLVPSHATWAVLRMRSTDTKTNKALGKFFIHTMQILPRQSCRMMETMKILSINSDTESVLVFKVQEDNILELCIAKYWSNHGSTHVKYSLEFHGVRLINSNAGVMNPSRGIHRLELGVLIMEEIQPAVTLKNAVVVLKPNETKISPLSPFRDVIPEGRQVYQNMLTYSLNVTKAQEVSFNAPLFNSMLYEAEFESQLWMLFDSNKAMVACGDAHSHTFYTKLEKGEYTLKLQIRHEKRDLLEKVNEATMLATFKLASPLNLDVYDTYNSCMIGERKVTLAILRNTPAKVMYVAPLTQEKLSKANLPPHCAWLSGALLLSKTEASRKIEQHDFTYLLSPSDTSKKNGNGAGSPASNSTANGSKAKTAGTTATLPPAPSTTGDGSPPVATSTNAAPAPGSPKKGKCSDDDYNEALVDFQCSMLAKCDLEKAEKIHADVLTLNPKCSQAHMLLIQNIESAAELKAQYPFTFAKGLKGNEGGELSEDKPKEDVKKLKATLERTLELTECVINETDKDALLAFYGIKNDTRADASKIKTTMDKQKNTLLEALAKKGVILAKLALIDNKLEERVGDLDALIVEIMKFCEVNDSKVVQFAIWHAYAHQQYGRMSKFLGKIYDEKRNRDCLEELELVFGAMNYPHMQTTTRRLIVSSFPSDFRIF